MYFIFIVFMLFNLSCIKKSTRNNVQHFILCPKYWKQIILKKSVKNF